MRLHLSRWVCLDVEANLRRLHDEVEHAVAGGCELVVFPELMLTGYRRELEPERALAAFAELSSSAPRVLFVFGSVSVGGCNRMQVWLGGAQVAHYDKVHLFHPNREHEMWRPGDRYSAVRWRGHSIGLINCNDVRFPEQARALRLQSRCELLVAVAWWPWRRDHVWSTLLRARAIENGVHVAGCAIAASDYPDERFAGAGNHVFDPLGEAVRTSDDCTYELYLESQPELVVDPLEHAVRIDRVEVFEAGE